MQCRFGNAEGGDVDCIDALDYPFVPYCSASGKCESCQTAPGNQNAFCASTSVDTPICVTEGPNIGMCGACMTNQDCVDAGFGTLCDDSNFCQNTNSGARRLLDEGKDSGRDL